MASAFPDQDFPSLGSVPAPGVSADGPSSHTATYASTTAEVQQTAFPSLAAAGARGALGSPARATAGSASSAKSAIPESWHSHIRPCSALEQDSDSLVVDGKSYGVAGLPSRDDQRAVPPFGRSLSALHEKLGSSADAMASLGTPWATVPVANPIAANPAEYSSIRPPKLRADHFARFADATLLYIVLNMQKDMSQLLAAKELYSRRWLYAPQAAQAAGVPEECSWVLTARNQAGGEEYRVFKPSDWRPLPINARQFEVFRSKAWRVEDFDAQTAAASRHAAK